MFFTNVPYWPEAYNSATRYATLCVDYRKILRCPKSQRIEGKTDKGSKSVNDWDSNQGKNYSTFLNVCQNLDSTPRQTDYQVPGFPAYNPNQSGSKEYLS